MEEFRHQLREGLVPHMRNWDCSMIRGHVAEFARDQDGSRMIQRRLEKFADTDLDIVFNELMPEALALMTDVFGNYVIQKILEHGANRYRQGIVDAMKGSVLKLTLQTYGCRVVQKTLETCPLPMQLQMIRELTGYLPVCVTHQNGNHVIQKCIECIPDNIDFLMRAFIGEVRSLATHAYGCRVMQRILEYCRANPSSILAQQCKPIMEESVELLDLLIDDQYGNYVLQHVMLANEPEISRLIISKLVPRFYELSTKKFASNVVEKMFEVASMAEKSTVCHQLMDRKTRDGQTELVALMKDQYSNYVAQRVLDLSNDRDQYLMSEHIRPHVGQLRKYTHGKHIITRVDKILSRPMAGAPMGGGRGGGR
eukprot:TRINITY_DN6781_c3_g1_i1.p1 TRINITY_DN6781_c3_g1~~TRINITY_DN6781_c3_g1_i1.p1  ORF type:complete len:388 (+),score=141.40 TRINITY_DN6781_c3_g1_i1:61-1164(+)